MIRYLILDAKGNILYRIKWGSYFGQWDFSVPGEMQGGRAVDLHVLSPEDRAKYGY